MCGIAAWIDWNGRSAADEVARMTECISHRGPDGSGSTGSEGVTLGHRRLSIIDLSTKGAQPMSRGDVTVTFNGEIYNYVELRAELALKGHRFQSHSDTEILLAAYEEWGTDCVQHFNGMWAFVLHDLRSGTVFASRDRFGEKPLLYLVRPSGVVLASEARQFQVVGLGSEPNLDTLREFLVFGRRVSTEETFVSGVRSVPPATNVLITLATKTVAFAEYYTPGASTRYEGLDEDALLHELDVQFRRSIQLRLRSDVQVGMLLSGGIDSSLVAAYAAPAILESTGKPLVAITALSGDAANDESKFARLAAETVGAEWEPVSVSPEVTRDSWRESTRMIEQPLASSSNVMELRVMERAAQAGLIVVLNGQGADESWMGYERYAAAAIGELPWRRRAAFAHDSAKHSGLGLGTWLAQLVYFRAPELARLRSTRRLSAIGLDVDANWYRARFRDTFGSSRGSMLARQRLEVMGEQLSSQLRYADLTSMAFSVEDRMPFLDHNVVDLALSTPTELLFRDGWSKWPLRKVLSRMMPPMIAWREWKIGFEAPRTSFEPRDAESQATIRGSEVLREMGVRTSGLDTVAPPILWRLFAIALWEQEVLSIKQAA